MINLECDCFVYFESVEALMEMFNQLLDSSFVTIIICELTRPKVLQLDWVTY
jgi:hypothetical protein